MDVVEAVKGTHQGQWWPLNARGRRKAALYCPDCNHYTELTGYNIHPGGLVDPEVTCSGGCGFTARVQLVGWPL